MGFSGPPGGRNAYVLTLGGACVHIHHAYVGLAMIWVGVTARLLAPLFAVQGWFDALTVSGFGVLLHDVWIEIRQALRRSRERQRRLTT